MELLKDLELMEVEYADNDQKCVMTFFDTEVKQILNVNFNKQIWDDGKRKYVPDEEKAETVEQWSQDYFGVDFMHIGDCIGVKKDIYLYDNFASLWECQQIEKFTQEMVGSINQTVIDDVMVDDKFIKIRYTIDGKQYDSKLKLAKYVDSLGEYIADPLLKKKTIAKFESKYGVKFENAKDIIGMNIFVEVKSAFGKFYYGDIKVMKK